jgi:hypothetical protein
VRRVPAAGVGGGRAPTDSHFKSGARARRGAASRRLPRRTAHHQRSRARRAGPAAARAGGVHHGRGHAGHCAGGADDARRASAGWARPRWRAACASTGTTVRARQRGRPGSRCAMLPTLASLGDRGSLDVVGALARLPAELDRAMRRLRKHGAADVRAAVHEVELLLLDGRLRERVAAAPPTVDGLATVARDYAPRAVQAGGGRARRDRGPRGRGRGPAGAGGDDGRRRRGAAARRDLDRRAPERPDRAGGVRARRRGSGRRGRGLAGGGGDRRRRRADRGRRGARAARLGPPRRSRDRRRAERRPAATVRVNPAAVAVEHSRRRRDTASDTGR